MTTDDNTSYLGEDNLKKDNEHEYYESYYRNSTENTNLSHFKDRSPVFLEIIISVNRDILYHYIDIIHRYNLKIFV